MAFIGVGDQARDSMTDLRDILTRYGVRVMPRPYLERRHLAYEPEPMQRPKGIFVDLDRNLWHANVDGADWRPLQSLLDQLAAAIPLDDAAAAIDAPVDAAADPTPPAPPPFLADCRAAGISIGAEIGAAMYWGRYAGELVLLYCESRLIGLPGGQLAPLDRLPPAAPPRLDRPSPPVARPAAAPQLTQLSLF